MRRPQHRLTRQKDSPETRRLKSEAAKAAAAERLTRKRWYITLNLKPAPMHTDQYGRLVYTKQAWPKLFKSEQAAWDFASSMTGHPGKGIWHVPPGFRKVVSYCLSTKILPA
jgi:hypothetical protein